MLLYTKKVCIAYRCRILRRFAPPLLLNPSSSWQSFIQILLDEKNRMSLSQVNLDYIYSLPSGCEMAIYGHKWSKQLSLRLKYISNAWLPVWYVLDLSLWPNIGDQWHWYYIWINLDVRWFNYFRLIDLVCDVVSSEPILGNMWILGLILENEIIEQKLICSLI